MLRPLSAFKWFYGIGRKPGGTIPLYPGRTIIMNTSRGARLLKISNTRLYRGVATESREIVDKSLKNETDFNKILEVLGNGDENVIHVLKKVNWKYLLCKEDGSKVPSVMTLENYQRVFKWSERHWPNYFFYLYVKEEERKKKLVKKEENCARFHEMAVQIAENAKTGDERLIYGLWSNQIMIRYRESYMTAILNSNLVPAHQFSQKLILDFSYGSLMSSRLRLNACDQVAMLVGRNRYHINPFHIIMCNVDKDHNMGKELLKMIPTVYDKDCLLADVTEKSYLDIFPKEKLVYLTPHAKDELTEVSDDDIYIIGVYNDKGCREPHSLAISKKQNLRSAKLPLDKFLQWVNGSKSLALPQMISILLDQRNFKNWEMSLRHVPSRFVNPYYVNKLTAKHKMSFAVQ